MWPHVACTALGAWLMAAPQLLGYHGPARTNDHITGPVVATFACVAIWEATRAVRWVNVALGGWLVLAPWALGYTWPLLAHGTAAGLLLAGLAAVRGERRNRIGGGWVALWGGAGEGAG